MPGRYDTITFLSDLGTVDESVGLVHAVVRDLAPHARVVDLAHDVPPYDVRAGSLVLARAIGYVPSGVVIASVDAGPQSGRPLVAIEVAGGEGVLIGPDNGLLAPAVAMAGGAERAVVLSNVEYQLGSPGGPFPARDVFGPVAAHLCNGVPLTDLGDEADVDLLLPGIVPLPRDAADDGIAAEVLWINRVGDCQLNVGADDLGDWGSPLGARMMVLAGEVSRVAERVTHSGELGAGSIGLVVDPFGMLALVLDRRSAAEELQLAVTDQVVLTPLPENDRGPGATTSIRMSPRR
ncbi:MAG: SAM hydrolase/SAM-dependent halogenase family protein [Ilumatobacteraceae bacterium]